jgi:hypothetical protein
MKLQHRGMMTPLVVAACALPGCLYAGDKPEPAKLPVPKMIRASCAEDDTAAKPEMDTAAAEKFKTLSPKMIVVKTGEERSWDVNRLEVEMQLSGRGEMRWSDGRFTKAEIVTDRCLPDSGQEDAELRRVWMNGGVTRRCRAMLILTYSMKDGDAVLKVPFEFMIWREANGAEGFKDVKVDVENAFVLARSRMSAVLK